MSNAIKSASRGDCDRCGANVQAHDDCTYLEEVRFALLNGKRPFCGFTKGRHIACSPSWREHDPHRFDGAPWFLSMTYLFYLHKSERSLSLGTWTPR